MTLRACTALTALIAAALLGQAFPGDARSAGGIGPGEGAIVLPLDEVELADDPGERQRGLMSRRRLCPGCAMLFVHPGEEVLSFWMKDTFISLDMIFIDSSGTVVTLHEGTVPHRKWPPYVSSAEARYVLEVNSGFAAANGILPGSRIDLESLFAKTVNYRWVGR